MEDKENMKKLSEMSTVDLSRVLCTIADPAERIFSDPEVMEMLGKFKTIHEESHGVAVIFMTRVMTTIAPVMLGEKHLDDVCTIVATLKGVPVVEVKEQAGMETIRDVWDMLTGDKDLAMFFRPSGKGKVKKNQGGAV